MIRALVSLLLVVCLSPPLLAAPSTLPLDDAQRLWLADHDRLRVGAVLQAPYVQLDRRLQQLSGANVELMNWLARELGVELIWRTYDSQGELEQALRAGLIDLAPGLSQTPAGLRLWLFSDPYMRVSQLVVGEREGNAAVDLEQLDGTSPLALRHPSGVFDYLRSTYTNLELRPMASERQALQALLAEQVRYAVLDEAQLSRLSREQEFAGLAVVADIGFPQLLRVASRRDWPELAAIVDIALRNLPAKDLDLLHERWLQPKYPRLGESAGFWQNLSLLLGVLLLSAAAIITWLRRQRRGLERQLLDARHALQMREAAEEALRLTQFSIDHSTLGVLWVNWDSHVRYANRAAEQMLGYASGSLADRPLADFQPELNMDRWLNLWRRVRNSDEGPLGFETRCLRPDGSWLPADVSLSFLRFGSSEYLVVFLSDATERRRAREALEESEARLKGIASNVPGLVFRLERPAAGAPSAFAFIGEGSEGLVGYSASELLDTGRGIRGLVHPEDRDGYWASQLAALDADRDWHWQGRILTRDGQLRWADIKASARVFEDGRAVWDGVVWDITDNKQIELELAASRAQLRELSAHLESVREEEKARIAREVHDELGQVLTVLKLETSMCELAYADLDEGLKERLESMKRLIAQLFQLVRDVATALRPPILDAGIGSAIEWQARRFEARTQIPCLVEVPEHLPAISDAKAVGLFRVLQEALTNVMRHAEAHTVEVRLSEEGGQLCLRISDDGRGFDTSARRGSSFGLVGMGERVLMLGGSLEIDSQPGEGTTLCVRVALDKEKAA
ncbi:PAS domain S-box protein [Metapseudomonas furukawaii]|uniref:PAS domain-containing sensor histidine kinase n=1 Tax=Metapseudomonas furukawaii TaxID=1149133 RepID=UPI00227BBBB8|nr:sensor histidine kinase [Pseudomonas furukawaii]WAG79610.1 PAS domain S-box protein [Pseudomonas furukawaii]